jgi:transcriptional regulator with XRE-family HTH domain
MSQDTIGQRLKILLSQLDLDIKGFCQRLDISETTVRNYFSRGNNPNADFLAKLTTSFDYVNLSWLLTGNGAIFLSEPPALDKSNNISNKKNKGPVQNNTGDNNTITNNVQLEDCKRDLEKATTEVKHLQAQLAAKDDVIASKDAVIASQAETLSLLRGGYTRPN